ncbi:MAG: hypothetical protein ACTH1D_08175 [Mycobacteriaceae bacterium]
MSDAAAIERTVQERNRLYQREVEDFFRSRLVDQYAARAADAWPRDYSSTDDYLDSVEPMREAWRALLAPPDLAPSAPCLVDTDWLPGADTSGADSWWLSLPLEDGLTAQAGLAVPKGGASHLVVFQHGLASSPERVFGIGDDSGSYDDVGHLLLEAGFAVLAPFNLTFIGPRNRAQRLARLAGTTMEGLEYARVQLLLDEAQKLIGTSGPVGLWGCSWGGMATQFWTPLSDRFSVAITSAFFNHRPNKMVVQDTRYGTFEDSGEDHAFLPGHLTHFGDADLASLICPRPLQVQIGKRDAIGWWPQIKGEFELARSHWDRLGHGDRVDLELHERGHRVQGAEGVAWMERWLTK